ncbi:hypothetical protein MHYP_G00289150 [Metynnis hypsauchen]
MSYGRSLQVMSGAAHLPEPVGVTDLSLTTMSATFCAAMTDTAGIPSFSRAKCSNSETQTEAKMQRICKALTPKNQEPSASLIG